MQQVKLDFSDINKIEAFKERILKERDERLKNQKTPLRFGVKFFDNALGGIYPNDLLVVGAASGLGKTELVTQVAMANALDGKRVHFFALEAEKAEIERRIKYRLLAEIFFKGLKEKFPNLYMDYTDWYYGKLDEQLGPYESEIDARLGEMYGTLSTYYREFGDYTVNKFEKQLLALQDQTDLIIIDHLHYFDSDDENENRAVKAIVKKIRDLALLTAKPIILVAHIRKRDRKFKQLLPDLEDFHGTSDIGKIATKAITIGPATAFSTKTLAGTYMRAVKCRTGAHRTRWTALACFDVTKNKYEDNYWLGVENENNEFVPTTKADQIPAWATGASIGEKK